MTRDFGRAPAVFWLALVASAMLAASWISYLAYLCSTTITKQSVYMGPITFYAAALLVTSGVCVAVQVASLIRLRGSASVYLAPALWCAGGAVAAAIAVFAATRPMIAGAV